MSTTAKKMDKKYTYADYLTWDDGERWELIDGVAYNMSPAPTRRHQEILGMIFNRFFNYLEGKPCQVFIAPFDVRLEQNKQKDEELDTVVQPDIMVVCDKSKLDERGCKGAPDLVVEIVSPSTASVDYIKKLELYEKNGVKEYWIVHPTDKIVMVYKLLADGKYGKPETYSQENKVSVGIFLGELEIDLGEVFRER